MITILFKNKMHNHDNHIVKKKMHNHDNHIVKKKNA